MDKKTTEKKTKDLRWSMRISESEIEQLKRLTAHQENVSDADTVRRLIRAACVAAGIK